MRYSDRISTASKARIGVVLAAALLAVAGAGSAAAMQPAGSLEARLRALEARVAALEGRGAAAPAAAGTGINCTALGVNGSGIVPGATLTVTVNGATVGVYDGGASGALELFMKPGPNIVGLSFAGPGKSGPFGTQAELRCLPPGSRSSRTEILRLQPSPGRLSAQAQVNLVR